MSVLLALSNSVTYAVLDLAWICSSSELDSPRIAHICSSYLCACWPRAPGVSAASSSERYVSVGQLWMECTSVNACVIQHCLCWWSCRDGAPLSSVSSSHHNPLPEGLVDRSVLSTTIQQRPLNNVSVRSAYIALLLVISHIMEFVHAFFDF